MDVCIPGDIVSVSGVVKALKNEPPSSFKQVEKNRCLFILYIDGNNLRISKTVSDEMESNQDKDKNSEFSLRDLHAIRSIHCSQNLMKLIVNSLCPSIYGHEIVKGTF